ncbi:MAG: hypothetical protein H6Q51_2167 [Deltaproteobacteria bacterium]|nr:hypothetical protein [Deltaproteobacteria bacterium]
MVEILVIVDEPLEDEPVDGAARAVCSENGVEELGVADRGAHILGKALRAPLRLLLVGGHPEVGLKQEEDHQDRYGNQGATHTHPASYLTPRREVPLSKCLKLSTGTEGRGQLAVDPRRKVQGVTRKEETDRCWLKASP